MQHRWMECNTGGWNATQVDGECNRVNCVAVPKHGGARAHVQALARAERAVASRPHGRECEMNGKSAGQ